jgi:hypothetical protein
MTVVLRADSSAACTEPAWPAATTATATPHISINTKSRQRILMADLPGLTFKVPPNGLSVDVDCTRCVRLTMTRVSCSRVESISHPSHVEQEPRLGRIGLELPPETDDVVVDDAVVDGNALAPDPVEELLGREQAARAPPRTP